MARRRWLHGAFAQVLTGVGHTLANPGSTPATFLAMAAPGGFENYFDELPCIIDKHGRPSPLEIMRQLGAALRFRASEHIAGAIGRLVYPDYISHGFFPTRQHLVRVLQQKSCA